MIEYCKKKVLAGIYKALGRWKPYHLAFSNFISLGLLRATDALVFLFLIPLVISRTGIANYGIIAFVQVFLNYGNTIVNYGFNITGVREVAIYARNKKALSQVVSNILFTRIFIAALTCLGLVILINLIPLLAEHCTVFYWGLILIMAQALFFDWLFIGLQKAKFIAVANLASKLLFALLVLFFIKQPVDYIYILGFQGGAALFSGLLVIFFLRFHYRLSLSQPSAAAIRQYLKTDFKLLASNLSIEINTSYSLLVINILTTNSLTGFFSVMQKLVQPLRFLLVIFSQALFPIACKKAQEGWKELTGTLRSTIFLFLPVFLGATALMAIFAGPLLTYFARSVNVMLTNCFRAYLFVPLIILSNIPAYQVLLAYNRKSDYFKVYVLGLGFNLIGAYLLARVMGLPGLILALIIVELIISLGLYFMVWKNQKILQLKSPGV